MDAPLLVVVTGMPSSGKTTIATALAERLRLPLVAKDDLKESLFETLGPGDVAWSGRLGDAAYDLMFALARTMLAARVPLIVEANFFAGQATRFITLPEHRLVQIHCDAPLAVLLERYAARERHPGHNDGEKLKELPARHASGAHAPLDVPGETIRLDTSEPVDIATLAESLRALHLAAAPASEPHTQGDEPDESGEDDGEHEEHQRDLSGADVPDHASDATPAVEKRPVSESDIPRLARTRAESTRYCS